MELKEVLGKTAEALREHYKPIRAGDDFLKVEDCWPSFEEDYEEECEYAMVKLTPLAKGLLVEIERTLVGYDANNFGEEIGFDYYPLYVPEGHEEDIPEIAVKILRG